MSRKTLMKWLPIILSPIILPFIVLNVMTVYDKPAETEASYAPYQIPNGGFESGNLDGWRAYRLWKDEPGMAAFDSSLVHDKNYFAHNAGAGHPYGKDGSYQLGITSEADQYTGTIQWEQAAERMGYLRSTDFVLGGSGWMSFKLGGGKMPEFAHVSIRKTLDNVEVARFGNAWFNDTAKASIVYGSTITNAEAFLFPYYFDLSSVTSLGTSLYILLSDTSGKGWSILSADSFVTYYPTAPTIPEAIDDFALATNIVPIIQGISGATNSIPNGNFDSDTSGWEISGNAWEQGDFSGDGQNYADLLKSNKNGDGGMGVARSSAFLVTTNKYVRFDWSGGLKFDKQIFVSVKEVNTNIEMIRFVRRDNLSSKASANYDNHLLNLSSLDNSKKYYLEFSDSVTDGWGIALVDSVRIITEAEYNGITSGDRAATISGVPTSFDLNYTQESVSFAQYFLEQTGPICTAMTGDFSSVWGTMATEYATLSNDAKDYFTASGTTESTVVAARERYLFIVGKYTSLDKFVVNSSDVVYQGASDIIGYDVGETSRIILIIVVGVMVLSTGAFFLISRRRKETA